MLSKQPAYNSGFFSNPAATNSPNTPQMKLFTHDRGWIQPGGGERGKPHTGRGFIIYLQRAIFSSGCRAGVEGFPGTLMAGFPVTRRSCSSGGGGEGVTHTYRYSIYQVLGGDLTRIKQTGGREDGLNYSLTKLTRRV